MGTQPVSISRQTDAWTYTAASSGIVNTATAVTIKATAGATDLQVDTATLGATTELKIRDNAGGTALWRCQLQTAAPPIMSANFQSPLVGLPKALHEVVTPTAVTSGVFVNAQRHAGS